MLFWESACKCLLVDGGPVSFGRVLASVYWLMGVQLILGGVLARVYWLMGNQLVSGECLQLYIGFRIYFWLPLDFKSLCHGIGKIGLYTKPNTSK